MLKVIYQPEAEAELLDALPFCSSEGENDSFLAMIDHHVCESPLILNVSPKSDEIYGVAWCKNIPSLFSSKTIPIISAFWQSLIPAGDPNIGSCGFKVRRQ